MIATTSQVLDRLREAGFDASYRSRIGAAKVACSRCAASIINGVACHETGCPNQQKSHRGDTVDEDEYHHGD